MRTIDALETSIEYIKAWCGRLLDNFVTKAHGNKTYSNAITSSVSGDTIVVTDISPLEHELNVKVRSKNLIPYPYYESSANFEGVDWVDNGDGTFTATGTSTAAGSSYRYLINKGVKSVLLKAGTYTFSFADEGVYDGKCRMRVNESDSNGNHVRTLFDLFSTETHSFAKDIYITAVISVPYEHTVNGFIFKPQIELGETFTGYTPYVQDLSSVKVYKQGKNLFNLNGRTERSFGALENTTVRQFTGDSIYNSVAGSNWYKKNCNAYSYNHDSGEITYESNEEQGSHYGLAIDIKVEPNTSYYLSAEVIPTNFHFIVSFYDHLGGHLTYCQLRTSGKITTPANAAWMLVILTSPTNGVTGIYKNVQLEKGDVQTEFERPVDIETYSVNADGTVDGITSIHPSISLTTNTVGVIIDCEYTKDSNKVSGGGTATVVTASRDDIDAKASDSRPISVNNLDYAVKVGVTTNTEVLTDEEKAAAQAWLGVDEVVGDVDAALDVIISEQESIIAILDSLIGGTDA